MKVFPGSLIHLEMDLNPVFPLSHLSTSTQKKWVACVQKKWSLSNSIPVIILVRYLCTFSQIPIYLWANKIVERWALRG